eukprot:CAMPEP_0119357668 /NCGR_PEP_ID=MMETSP1334-20130426/6016_1 /TAXON_ID=127549 /ORGANISM="Calcidiscus leptoporus, Strain RCC1130" /LENGTH=55 /DNA_ID=CAMNT_0007371969 /DNA_START=480 /DNA_END=650 /DNA_ORIENTATION=+
MTRALAREAASPLAAPAPSGGVHVPQAQRCWNDSLVAAHNTAPLSTRHRPETMPA